MTGKNLPSRKFQPLTHRLISHFLLKTAKKVTFSKKTPFYTVIFFKFWLDMELPNYKIQISLNGF